MITLVFVLVTLSCVFGNEIAVGNNQFSADIYKELSRSSNDNLIFSPFSALTVLAFVGSGARGETAEELRTRLHLPNNQNLINVQFKNLGEKLKTKQDAYSFHSANKLYVEKNFVVKDEFKKVAFKAFDADIQNVEFSESDKTAKLINEWVEEETNKKIQDLITPDKLDSRTRAVLVNALYLKANWSNPFLQRATRKRSFFKSDRVTLNVDTMTMIESDALFTYAENEAIGAKFLELPMECNVEGSNRNHLSMVFVVPTEESSLANLEKNIDQVFSPQEFTRQYVNISIPKFKIKGEIDFKKIITNLGVKKAFNPGEADFKGISDSPLSISDVIQKTFIDVNEAGVEAAAATYARLTLLSIGRTPEFKQFHADRPFIYYIKFNEVIIFAGRVVDPEY